MHYYSTRLLQAHDEGLLRDMDYKIIWECNNCTRQREDYVGQNENALCMCGGTFEEVGVSYSNSER